jgi:Zn-dependent protease
LIALTGPAVNAGLAGLAESLRFGFRTQGALDAFLLMLVIGNVAAAIMSLAPIGSSDGARALRGLRARQRPRLPVRARIRTMRMSRPSGDQP